MRTGSRTILRTGMSWRMCWTACFSGYYWHPWLYPPSSFCFIPNTWASYNSSCCPPPYLPQATTTTFHLYIPTTSVAHNVPILVALLLSLPFDICYSLDIYMFITNVSWCSVRSETDPKVGQNGTFCVITRFHTLEVWNRIVTWNIQNISLYLAEGWHHVHIMKTGCGWTNDLVIKGKNTDVLVYNGTL